MPSSRALRLVAALEGLKGVVVLLAASGLLALVHHDVHKLAATLVEHAHLNPAAKYPKIFLDAAAEVNDPRLWQLAAGAAAYSIVRLVEGYGLYRERAWAEVLAALSGAIYIPFELTELLHRPTGLASLLLALNVAIVAFMVYTLNARRKAGRGAASQETPSK
jgi:uncharacterized membrane protein (DUF2068 family)